jgi:NADP-dependent 3-hydroxy acid dehydrogenase YdfG
MLRPGDVADAVLFALSRPAGVNVDLVRVSPA